MAMRDKNRARDARKISRAPSKTSNPSSAGTAGADRKVMEAVDQLVHGGRHSASGQGVLLHGALRPCRQGSCCARW